MERYDLDSIIGVSAEEASAVVEVPIVRKNVPRFQQRMLDAIQEMDEYSWKRGEMGGLDWGFSQFNTAFEGLNTGVHLIAGQSNVGKSGICMQLAWQIAQANQVPSEKQPRKAYVVYFSLDDTANELLPRIVAIDQKVPINCIRFPKKYEHEANLMMRRAEGLQNLKDSVAHFDLRDANDGTDIEYIEETAKTLAFELAKIDEAYQIVLFIDNFHDVTVRDIKFGADNNAKYDYIAGELSRIATALDCPIVCTAEFRKLNGNRRPQLDDIRETVKIIYEAKAIMLCYNEVGLRGQQGQIFWNLADHPDKQPVFEVRIGKNKFSSFKGRIFFEFSPEMSYFREVPPAGAQRYNQMISG